MQRNRTRKLAFSLSAIRQFKMSSVMSLKRAMLKEPREVNAMSKKYRCTRNALYQHDCGGRDDVRER
jgi:hypothetical protein